MVLAVMVISAAAAGYVLLDPASGRTGALVQAFAGGALLAMLADTLLPEAYMVEGVLTGPVKMWRSLIMGLVLSAGLTRTGPDCVSLPGFVGLSDKTMWCTRPGGLV
jgi:zinc transporter, ZIP family